MAKRRLSDRNRHERTDLVSVGSPTVVVPGACGSKIVLNVKEAVVNVRSTNTRHILEEAARTSAAELQQLCAWRTTWK